MMSNRLTDCAAGLGVRICKSHGDDHARKIESLEFENFELRNEVTRLTLHNATLRRMLKIETAKFE
jgi:hypothetical protein